MLQFNFLSRLLSLHHRQKSRWILSVAVPIRFPTPYVYVCMHECHDGYPSLAVFLALLSPRSPHCCPGSHSAFNTAAQRIHSLKITDHHHVFVLFFLLQNTSGMESQNLVDDLSPKKNTVLKVCVNLWASVFHFLFVCAWFFLFIPDHNFIAIFWFAAHLIGL